MLGKWDRESLFEDFAADLVYHPRRGAIYVAVGAAAIIAWFTGRGPEGYWVSRTALAFGGVALVVKGLFMFRRRSGGFEGTDELLASPVAPKGSADTIVVNNPGSGEPLPHQAAQMIQDFAIGPLLLWPLVHVVDGIRDMDGSAQAFPITVAGVLLYAAGWALRRATVKESPFR